MNKRKIEKMYCPVCLNYTMELSENGLIHLTINNRRITRGKFFFNRGKDYQSFVKGLNLALEDFYKLYSDFKNPMVIENIELYSSDLTCKEGCSYDGNVKVSVVDILVLKDELWRIAMDLGKKYKMKFKT